MIPVKIQLDNYIIRNIESNDLNEVLKCVNECEDSFRALGRSCTFSYEDIKQRYLETLVSSLEFFCGIFDSNRIIGIIKGRIESKERMELWILSFILIKEYRNKLVGTNIVASFENYFGSNYSIDKICVLVIEENARGKKFWVKNGYEFIRTIKTINNSDPGMAILEKKKISC